MENKPTAVRVYESIKSNILTCVYQPGQLLSEKEIVEEFNTSRTPVREALNTLNGEGLLDILPKKGVQVSILSPRKLREVYELRSILEPVSLKYAFPYIQQKDIDYLIEMDQILAKSVEEEDVPVIFQAGKDYHLYLAKLSHNETLYSHLTMLRQESYRGLTYFLTNYILTVPPEEKKKILQIVGGGHAAITEALIEKDLDAAMKALALDLSSTNVVIDQVSLY